MAIPTFQAAGTPVAGGDAISPAWPTHETNDIGLLLVGTTQQAVTLSGTPASDWTEIPDGTSPQGTGDANQPGSARLTVFWARAISSTMGTPTVDDAGAAQGAFINTYRGVIATGNPWNVKAGDVETPAATAITVPGATTTVADCLVVFLATHAVDDIVNQWNDDWTNANLTSIAERQAYNWATGKGGGLNAGDGGKATTGAIGDTTATIDTSSLQGRIMLALKPPVAAAGFTPRSYPRGANRGVMRGAA